jgi:hypothetical protein
MPTMRSGPRRGATIDKGGEEARKMCLVLKHARAKLCPFSLCDREENGVGTLQ